MKYVGLFCLLLLLCGLSALPGCNNDFARPTVELADMDIEGISLENIDVVLFLEVDNPNPFGVTVNRIAFDIEFERQGEWVFLGDADRDKEIFIEAEEVTTVDVPASVGTTEAVEALFELLGSEGGRLTLRADGNAWVDVQVTEVRVPFRESHEVEVDFPENVRDRLADLISLGA